MKKIFILLAALILLGGGGAAAWFLLLSPNDANADEAEPEEVIEPPPEPYFVDFQPLRVPLIHNGRIVQHVTLEFTLEVPDEAMADHVVQISPLLNDAYMSVLYGDLHYDSLLNGGVLDLEPVRASIEEASVGILGRDVVRQVLIQNANQQMF